MLLGLAACAGGSTGQEAAAVQAAPTTLRLEMFNDMDAVDPGVAYTGLSWQMEYATCAKLLNYADVEGQIQLVPDIAAALPEISADHTEYLFTIRDDFRFSPPSNAPVTTADVKTTFLRAMNLHDRNNGPGPAAFFMHDLLAMDLPARNQIRFRLRGPSGDFMHRVAMNFFCIVPSSYPSGVQFRPPATAGPYYIASYTPAEFNNKGFPIATGEIVLARNPGYPGGRPAGFDIIHYLTGSAAASVDDVFEGTADYLPEGVDPALAGAYGPDTTPSLFVHPMLGIRYLSINARRVTDVNVRQAINFAVDRAGLAALTGDTLNDDYLPPAIAGYQGTHPYMVADAVQQAKNLLVGAPPPSLIMYSRPRPFAMTLSTAVAQSLEAVGIQVTIVPIPANEYFTRLANPDEPYDIAMGGWLADYPDPFDFLNTLLEPGAPFDDSHFSDPTIDADLANAATLLGSARTAAYGTLDAELMAASPMAVTGNIASYDLFSAHVGCQAFEPMLGVDLAALCPQ
jgi:peptide/nickel transport system substrate-binding protein